MKLPPDLVVGHASDMISEELNGGLVLYSLACHKAMHLNETASLIWRLSDGSRTVQQIVEEVILTFPDDDKEVTEQTRDTLSRLLAEGALSSKIQ